MTGPGDNEAAMRSMMVRDQIERRGVTDRSVLDAMRRVPREEMVLPSDRRHAFVDGPLSIGSGQTISQPFIVAYMTEQLGLSGGERVLEIGTGSGYQTAVLAEIAARVYTIEIIDELAERAESTLSRLGYSNIEFRTGDGSLGWPEQAPFDAIIVTAAPLVMPETLRDQLAPGGRLVVPVGGEIQYLRRITRTAEGFEDERLIGVRFVPMTGRIERERH